MTNPDREELVTLADRLAFLSNVGFGYDIIDTDRSILRKSATALRRLASSGGGVKGEPEPVAWPANLNPRTLDLVQRFALALAKKLRLAEEKYDHTDGWLRDDWESECRDHLYQHLEKGDPRDVAAYCAFMWHHDWITCRPVITAPPADAGMREALEPFAKEADNWADSVSDDHRSLCTEPGSTTAHPGSETAFTVGDLRRAKAALTAPGATTKSDVEALAATTAERPGTVTSEPEPSTSDSARDDVPLGYERVTDGTTLPGDKFRYSLDNNGVTGKVIGHFRPIKPGPSDPSSTRSEVTVRMLASVLLDCPAGSATAMARALLDQFEIRRK